MYAKTFVFGGLVGLASAHIKMSAPVPYGASSLSNSPLLEDGSDFPCKQRNGVYEAEGASNVYELGSSGNDLAFVGSAVHGGGSCQVSITYDAQPDANSVWKVIKSIEGGCPAQDTPGNLPENANLAGPFKYSFDIPSDIPAGNGTIAWTWFNKVGNREMYMNCGPVTLTGDGGSEESYNSLPDMMVANLKNINSCSVDEGSDVKFPNPGQAVELLNGATDVFKAPNGDCGPTGSPGSGNGGGNGGGSSPAPTTAPPTTDAPISTPTPTGGADGSGPSLPGGVFIPVPDSSAPAPTAAPTEPIPEQPVTEEPTPEEGAGESDGSDGSTPTPAPETPEIVAPITETPVQDTPETEAPVPPTDDNTATTPGSACSNEGEWNCVGGTSFQRCASGAWSVVMQLSAGTGCEAGQGANINMIVTRNGRRRALSSKSA